VLWIYASNVARFEQSLREVAEQLRIYGRNDRKADLISLTRNWLLNRRNGKWLIILDNADDASFLIEPGPAMSDEARPVQRRIDFIPSSSEHGSLLITTRSRKEALKLVYESQVVDVQAMSKGEAEALLERKLGEASPDDRSLVTALDCMPLAIAQAAAYIKEMGSLCSVTQYREMIQESRLSRVSLLQREISAPDRDGEAINSILLTWQISFRHIQTARRSAAKLLSLMSFCDRLAIPQILLRAGVQEGTVGSSYSDFAEDIATLRSFSFISDTTSAGSWEMHRLVQDAMHTWLLDCKEFSTVLTQFVHHLCICFPTGRHENWPVCHILFPHAKVAAEYTPTSKKTLQEWATAMYKSAWYASEQGNFPDALKMATASMEVGIKELGKEDMSTLLSTAMVAMTYRNQGRWKEAEELEVKVMETRRTVLGAEHPDTLTSMANLASTYRNQGRWKEAEELEVKVVETSRTVLGAEHPSMLTSMNNLAVIYLEQRRWAEAEALQKVVVSVCKEKFGLHHPNTSSAVSTLAHIQHSGRQPNLSTLPANELHISSLARPNQHFVGGDQASQTREHPWRWLSKLCKGR
jgi:tetratricopeptide (TPR) repeat protein